MRTETATQGRCGYVLTFGIENVVDEERAAAAVMERVGARMVQLAWSNTDLARAFKERADMVVPLATMTGWFGGKGGGRSLPQARFLIHFPRVLAVEDRWLFSGDGPMERRADPTDAQVVDLVDDLADFAAWMAMKYLGRRRAAVTNRGVAPDLDAALVRGQQTGRAARAVKESRKPPLETPAATPKRPGRGRRSSGE